MSQSNESPFVTIEAVAKYFGVSTSTVRMWMRTNMVPKGSYVKLGRTYRFNLPVLVERLMHAQQDEVIAPPPESAPEQLELDLDEPNQAA